MNYVVINVLELPGTILQLHHVEIDVVNDVLEGGENNGDESQPWSESLTKPLFQQKVKVVTKEGQHPLGAHLTQRAFFSQDSCMQIPTSKS